MLVEITKIQKEEVATVTSLDVAETFGKEHRRVLQDIRELKCSEDFRLAQFRAVEYVNEQGHNQSMFIMTRDGFTLLARGIPVKRLCSSKKHIFASLTQWKKLLSEKSEKEKKALQSGRLLPIL